MGTRQNASRKTESRHELGVENRQIQPKTVTYVLAPLLSPIGWRRATRNSKTPIAEITFMEQEGSIVSHAALTVSSCWP